MLHIFQLNSSSKHKLVLLVLPFELHSALNLGTYPDKLWPEGRVPYMLEEALDEEQRVAIAQAFGEYNNKTCIRFVPRNDDDYDYIFVKQNKFYGLVGKFMLFKHFGECSRCAP